MKFNIGDMVNPTGNWSGQFMMHKEYQILGFETGYPEQPDVRFPMLRNDRGVMAPIHPNNIRLARVALPTEAGSCEYDEIMQAQNIVEQS
jgi:hypothetical protein